MTERRRVFFLILIMIVTCLIVKGFSIMILYHTSLQQQRARLVETAQSQARLIEAMARFDAKYNVDYPEGPTAATLSQITDAHEHYKGFGETGEFTLSKREGGNIVFLLNHRHYDLDNPRPVPFKSERAEPMRMALMGKSGTIIGSDYRGVRVLAAFEPVQELGLGIVAKIDLSEIREPFIKAGLITLLITIVVVLIGARIFLRIGSPILVKLEKRAATLETLNRKMTDEITLREKTENALREGEERYRILIETIPYGIQELDLSGCVTFANTAYTEITGHSEKELIGKPVYELSIDDLDGETWHRDVDFLLKERPEPKPYFTKNLTKDGRIIDLQLNWNFKRNNKGQITGFVSVVTDITEQKRAEEALVRELKINSAIAGLSSSLISKQAIEDISYTALESAKKITGSRFGYVGHIDPETGFLVSSTLTRDIWDACSVDNKEVVFKHFVGLFGWVLKNKKSLVANDPNNDSRSAGTPEGHIPIRRFISAPALIENNLVGQIALANKEEDYTEQDLTFVERVATLYAIAIQRNRAENELAKLNLELENRVKIRTAELEREVAERKQTEEKLRQSQTMLQAVFDGISDPLIMLGKDMIVEIMNKTAVRYYNVELQDVVGKPCYLGLKNRTVICERCKIPTGISGNQASAFERKGIMNPAKYERVAVYPIQEETVEAGAIIHITDITESKRIQTQLIRADRLSSLGQLSGGIAHEIRNPLASIRLFSDILSDENRFKRNDMEKEILDDINQNIMRIDAIIKRVLNYAKPPVMSSGKVNMNTIIRDTLKLFSTKLLDLKISQNLSLTKNIPHIKGDTIGLQQVITNLILNAMDAMSKGGVLSITTFKTKSSLFRNRPIVAIIIKDMGPGIKSEDRESIFNPFFTTKSTGTGLGLAISHQIIEYHGGTIYVESKLGEGSIFSIELPITKES